MQFSFQANPDTNYVFHMLSVAGCGYDNDYGRRYRALYPDSELAILRNHSVELTVRGGEHCGVLYSLLVCDPACARISAKTYYANLIHAARNQTLPEHYLPYADVIFQICTVMVKHYDHFLNLIWPAERERILAYIPTVERLFHDTSFAERAVSLVGREPPTGKFIATLVTSVENGAEGIDISQEQDVFGVERDPMDALYFIGHELIIYLLFSALKDEPAFHSFDTWCLTEGLAEYYLKKIMGDTRFFTQQQKYAVFYESCENAGKSDAITLYRHAYQMVATGKSISLDQKN